MNSPCLVTCHRPRGFSTGDRSLGPVDKARCAEKTKVNNERKTQGHRSIRLEIARGEETDEGVPFKVRYRTFLKKSKEWPILEKSFSKKKTKVQPGTTLQISEKKLLTLIQDWQEGKTPPPKNPYAGAFLMKIKEIDHVHFTAKVEATDRNSVYPKHTLHASKNSWIF